MIQKKYKYTFECRNCGEFSSDKHMRECKNCSRAVRQTSCQLIWFTLGFNLPEKLAIRLRGMVEMTFGNSEREENSVKVELTNARHTDRYDICIQPVDSNKLFGFKESAIYAKVQGFVHGCLLVFSFDKNFGKEEE